VTAAAAFFAWLGAAVIVLSDGRRGLALGLAVTTLGLAALALANGDRIAAAAVLVGGAVAAFQRMRTGRDVWGLMPTGSTPRLVLSIAGGFVGLWVATSVMNGPGAPLRFAALSVLVLMGARVVTASAPDAVVTALAALALSVAMAAGIADTEPGPSLYVAAALIASGVSVIRVAEKSGA
jgi:hypothetical protein